MTIAVTPEKIAKTQALLAEWPGDRRTASVHDVRFLLGKLLHLCEVVRPGKFFIRRILNQLGLPPLQVGEGRLPAARRRRAMTLTQEFRDDLAFWRLILEMSTGPDGVVRLEAPLLCSFLQPPSRILLSDASGDAVGGFVSRQVVGGALTSPLTCGPVCDSACVLGMTCR